MASTLIEEILDAAGVDYRHQQVNEDEVGLCCPFCPENGESEDHRFRLGINVKTGQGHCYNCHWKSSSPIYTARELNRVYQLGMSLAHFMRQARLQEGEKRPKEEPEPTGVPEGFEEFDFKDLDYVGEHVWEYLQERGVTKEQVRRHFIGFGAVGPMSWRAVFPVRFDGLIYGYVGRTIKSDVKPKYLNSPGIKLMWNGDGKGAVAIVSEGIMDALAIERAVGYQETGGFVSMSRLGSAITSHQLEQLKKFKSVMVVPDWDEAGLVGAEELCKRCVRKEITRVKICIPYKLNEDDPASMSRDQILDYLATAIPWNDSAVRRMKQTRMRRPW